MVDTPLIMHIGTNFCYIPYTLVCSYVFKARVLHIMTVLGNNGKSGNWKKGLLPNGLTCPPPPLRHFLDPASVGFRVNKFKAVKGNIYSVFSFPLTPLSRISLIVEEVPFRSNARRRFSARIILRDSCTSLWIRWVSTSFSSSEG